MVPDATLQVLPVNEKSSEEGFLPDLGSRAVLYFNLPYGGKGEKKSLLHVPGRVLHQDHDNGIFSDIEAIILSMFLC